MPFTGHAAVLSRARRPAFLYIAPHQPPDSPNTLLVPFQIRPVVIRGPADGFDKLSQRSVCSHPLTVPVEVRG